MIAANKRTIERLRAGMDAYPAATTRFAWCFERTSGSTAKHLLDRGVGTVALVLSSPLMLIVWILVRLTSSGPAIYAQTRIGLNGKLFYLYKFRSMYDNCEKKTGPVWASQNDSRVTPLGKIMRISYLDELPQLFNVVRGEMSLVGPRPERPEITARLRRQFPQDYYVRLLVKPGITGLAQIYQRADTNVDDVRRKLHYDLLYVRRASIWLDIKTIVRTVLMIVAPGAKPAARKAARKAARAAAAKAPASQNGHALAGSLLEAASFCHGNSLLEQSESAAVGTA